MKKVIITGANGFIGRHCLAPLISRGFEVHAVDIKEPTENKAGVQWHQVDLLDSEHLSQLFYHIRPSHLLHFAWYSKHGEYWTSVENIRWVQSSLQMLLLFADNGGERVVTAGTCAEYDWRYGFCSESLTPLAPTSLYGSCKNSLQMIQYAFGQSRGMSSAWGRVFFLYGPHEYPRRLVASVIRSLLSGESARVSHGEQIRDFLHVQDVANAFVALLESDVSGPVNVGSGKPIELRDLILTIARLMEKDQLVQWGSLPVPSNEPPMIVANVQRLREEVGWRPHYDLEAGIVQTIEWWSKRKIHNEGASDENNH